MSKRSSLFSLVQEYHNRNEDSEEDSDIRYEEDCFGWDVDDNVDFQPHQVDNGWDEISDNEQQQQDEEVIVSIGDVIVATDAPIANVSVADNVPVAGPSSKRRKTNAAVNKKKQNNVPPTFVNSKWRNGRHNIGPISVFDSSRVKINFDIPDNADELYFYKQFITDDIITDITYQTNLYAHQYLNENQEKLGENSTAKKFPTKDGGLHEDRIIEFALTYYMGLLRKQNIKHYWTTDAMMSTPFVCSIMSCGDFSNIMKFFHLVDNKFYPSKDSPGYDPPKKIGFLFTSLKSSFTSHWTPRQHLAIDEGCIRFKGKIGFKCYNPKKIEKYHLKTYKLVDSSNNYCLRIELYVGDLGLPQFQFVSLILIMLISYSWTIDTHHHLLSITYFKWILVHAEHVNKIVEVYQIIFLRLS